MSREDERTDQSGRVVPDGADVNSRMTGRAVTDGSDISLWQWFYRLLLLASGWAFFAWKDPAALIWIAIATLVGYGVGLELSSLLKPAGEADFTDLRRQRSARAVLGLSIVGMVGLLIFFKYGDLVTGRSLLIPLGLSYYSLMVIGYLIDVYRGTVCAEGNLIVFALYVGFFPQMTAGPVGRAGELLEQYRSRITVSVEDIKTGLLMIALGVYEKWVMADNLRLVVDRVMDSQATGVSVVLAMCLFSLVIYYDFAGYSLIAIGLGRLMGIRLTDNFHAPYLAASIREFWHRWHISLSTWFRDYLYIPLGGSRVPKWRRDMNTLIVFTVSGAWHGQAPGYWLWGLIHGAYLVVENRLRGLVRRVKRVRNGTDIADGKLNHGMNDGSNRKPDSRGLSVPIRLGQRFLVFVLVSLAWVPFYAGKLWKTGDIYGRMLDGGWDEFLTSFYDGFGLRWEVWLILGISVVFYLVIALLQEYFSYSFFEIISVHGWVVFIVAIVLYTVLLLVGVYGSSYDPSVFIYGGF